MTARSSGGRYDVLIVGGGPAGLSAALVLGRARRSVLVIDAGEPRNAAATHVGGYLGLEGIAPGDLLARGREQIAGYGVEIREGIAVSACPGPDGGFEVTMEDGTLLRGRKLLLCTGVRDRLPDLPGAKQLYGRGVHHCPYCDGWDHRDGRLAAYGHPEHAVPLALSLLTWSPDVTVLTDGVAPDDGLARRVLDNRITLRPERLERLEGDGSLQRAVLANGDVLELDALFFTTHRDQRSTLPRLLGCTIDERGEVVIDRGQGTGVHGLFLAGDASGDVQFVIVAAAEGAKAGVHINREMQSEERV